MKTVLTAIFDRKGEIYFPVQQQKSPAVACRDFQSACCNPKTPFHEYPEDYCLCVVGEMDNETGIIKPLERPRILAEATNFAIKEEPISVQEKN